MIWGKKLLPALELRKKESKNLQVHDSKTNFKKEVG